MITPTHESHLPKGIVIRHYKTSNLTEAQAFSAKWGGFVKSVKISGVVAHEVKFSNQ